MIRSPFRTSFRLDGSVRYQSICASQITSCIEDGACVSLPPDVRPRRPRRSGRHGRRRGCGWTRRARASGSTRAPWRVGKWARRTRRPPPRPRDASRHHRRRRNRRRHDRRSGAGSARGLAALRRRRALAGWVNRGQQRVIEYLVEENRVLREQLGGRRLRLTDEQRRRRAVIAPADLATERLSSGDTALRR